MCADGQESTTESHASSPNIFSNFYRDLLGVIRTAINQYHTDYNDQIKVLSDRVIHLEESQERWIAGTKGLMEEYQTNVLKKADVKIEELITAIQSLQSAVQHLETQTDQHQQIKAELATCAKELQRSFKITDRLVSDLNQLEMKQEEFEAKQGGLEVKQEKLDREFSAVSRNIEVKKRRFFSWFSR